MAYLQSSVMFLMHKYPGINIFLHVERNVVSVKGDWMVQFLKAENPSLRLFERVQFYLFDLR